MPHDDALFSPSVARNRDPILALLRAQLPPAGTVLEIASGTGEHAVHFAAALPGLTWQPSDADAAARRSIAAHREAASLPNLLAPLALDVQSTPWPVHAVAALVSINMIHIAPWSATLGLMSGAQGVLPAGGTLFLYGPYLEDDRETAPSNLAFDESLKARDPAWGIRRLADVQAVAARHDLTLRDRVEMPANNLALTFVRS